MTAFEESRCKIASVLFEQEYFVLSGTIRGSEPCKQYKHPLQHLPGACRIKSIPFGQFVFENNEWFWSFLGPFIVFVPTNRYIDYERFLCFHHTRFKKN